MTLYNELISLHDTHPTIFYLLFTIFVVTNFLVAFCFGFFVGKGSLRRLFCGTKPSRNRGSARKSPNQPEDDNTDKKKSEKKKDAADAGSANVFHWVYHRMVHPTIHEYLDKAKQAVCYLDSSTNTTTFGCPCGQVHPQTKTPLPFPQFSTNNKTGPSAGPPAPLQVQAVKTGFSLAPFMAPSFGNGNQQQPQQQTTKPIVITPAQPGNNTAGQKSQPDPTSAAGGAKASENNNTAGNNTIFSQQSFEVTIDALSNVKPVTDDDILTDK